MNKIFIIGLPRTATTSVCATLLDCGYTVAHTAYVNSALSQAQVIADTPVFADFVLLDRAYPDAKFINLTRKLSDWLPSIKQLLWRMKDNLLRNDGGFNPLIKRCYQQVFSPFTDANIQSDVFLAQCYQQHQQRIASYFADRPQDLLSIDVADSDSLQQLISFLSLPANQVLPTQFQQLNQGGKVTAWNQIKHLNKVDSTRNGKVETLFYLSEC